MSNFLPYGRQIIGDDDIAAVVDVLRSDYLTTGPAVERFEGDVCNYVGSAYGVAVSSGTAALHAVVHALGVGPGDEVIVPPITFAATSNCVLYCGGTPVFADVQADTLLIDPQKVEAAITPRTKAIIAVDYAGQPCDWAALRAIANKHGIALIADACHAIGASSQGGEGWHPRGCYCVQFSSGKAHYHWRRGHGCDQRCEPCQSHACLSWAWYHHHRS